MYGNNDINQIGGEGVARPCALPRASTRAPAPLGIIINLIPPLIRKAFREFRITPYNNNQPNFYTEKVGSVFVVNVRLIKIEIDRLSIIQTLNEHILRMFKDAVLSGIAKSALKRLLKHVEKN